MTSVEPATLAYLARRGVPQQWRGFLRALVETLDGHLDAPSRDGLLRAIGGQLGGATPLPDCATLAELEARMNSSLGAIEWGFVELQFDQANRAVLLRHSAAPNVATADDAEGAWMTPVLEGLYDSWFAAQPGAEAGVPTRSTGSHGGVVMLRYARV